MSSETTNLHLVKPTSADTADIGIINGNMDIIDTALVNIPTSSVIGLGDYYYQDNVSGTSVESNASATTSIASISVPPGFYIVRFAANFASNASGLRAIGIGKGSTTPVWRYTGVQVAPLNGAKTYLVTSNFSLCTADSTTFYGVAQQNSGSSLAVQGIIEAIRIK